MPSITTNFPIRPNRRNLDPWTIWYLLQWLANSIFDPFQNKFQQGTATVVGGTTSIAVPGISIAGGVYQVSVVPLSDPGSRYWVSAKTSSQFTINLQSAPAGNVTFDWTAKGP